MFSILFFLFCFASIPFFFLFFSFLLGNPRARGGKKNKISIDFFFGRNSKIRKCGKQKLLEKKTPRGLQKKKERKEKRSRFRAPRKAHPRSIFRSTAIISSSTTAIPISNSIPIFFFFFSFSFFFSFFYGRTILKSRTR